MTLTEFLLARIAEDEAVARQAPIDARRVSNDLGRSNPWEAEVTTDETWGANGEVSLTASRMLAECAAKRQIVYQAEFATAMSDPAFDTAKATTSSILRHLARAYSDHPDYDEAWRP
jgi:hypothetical protein